MSRLFAAFIFTVTSIAAQAANYQEVFQYNGNPQQIISAANKAFGAVKTKSVLGDTLTVQTKVDCLTGFDWLPVAVPMYGDIIIEAKDGKYRITFDAMKADSGYKLETLAQSTKDSCEKSFKEFSQEINKKMNSFSDF